MHDIDQLLQRTAAEPSQPVDAAQVIRRGRRRHRWRQGLAGASGVALIALAVLVVVPGSERPTVQFDPPAPRTDQPAAPTDPPAPRTDQPAAPTDPPALRTDLTGEEWEVMAVGVTSGVAGSRVATTQEELDEAWAWFNMEAPAPELPAGQAALLGHVAGDCDDASQVLGLERVPADSLSGIVGELAVVHVDADCAFIDRFGIASASPNTLYVIGVPVETAATVVAVVPVSAPVTDPEWRLLAVAPGAGGGGRGAAPADQASLDWVWSAWVGEEEAPEIPEGWTAMVASVPGNCTDPSQLRDVRSLGYLNDDGYGTVALAALFDPACADVQDLEAGLDQGYSLYVIIVPTEVALTLHGPYEYITCEEDDDVGACQDADRGLIHAYW